VDFEFSSEQEMLRDSVMDAVRREPVHLLDLDLEGIDRRSGHVIERERFSVLGSFITHHADQTHATFALHWNDQDEISFVEGDIHLSVDGRTASFDIGDIEDLPVSAARETHADLLTHHRPCAVTADDEARLTLCLCAV